MPSEANWIKTQIKAKRKDDEIIADLLSKGWKLEDAKLGLEFAKQPNILARISAKEFIIFTISTISIALFFMLSNVFLEGPNGAIGAQQYMYDMLPIGLIAIIAIITFSWSMYELCNRREHPILQKMFFLYSSNVVGFGISSLALIASFGAIMLFGIMFHTWLLIALIATISAISIIINEYSYSWLKSKYMNEAKRKIPRLIITGVLIGMIFGATMVAGMHYAEKKYTPIIDQKYQDNMADLKEAKEQLAQQIPYIPNKIIRDKLAQEVRLVQIDEEPMVARSVPELLQDSKSICNQTANRVINSERLGFIASELKAQFEYNSAQEYKSIKANLTKYKNTQFIEGLNTTQYHYGLPINLNGIHPKNLNYALIEDVESCLQDMNDQKIAIRQGFNSIYDISNISNPDQQDIVKQVLWTQKKLCEENGSEDYQKRYCN